MTRTILLFWMTSLSVVLHFQLREPTPPQPDVCGIKHPLEVPLLSQRVNILTEELPYNMYSKAVALASHAKYFDLNNPAHLNLYAVCVGTGLKLLDEQEVQLSVMNEAGTTMFTGRVRSITGAEFIFIRDDPAEIAACEAEYERKVAAIDLSLGLDLRQLRQVLGSNGRKSFSRETDNEIIYEWLPLQSEQLKCKRLGSRRPGATVVASFIASRLATEVRDNENPYSLKIALPFSGSISGFRLGEPAQAFQERIRRAGFKVESEYSGVGRYQKDKREFYVWFKNGTVYEITLRETGYVLLPR